MADSQEIQWTDVESILHGQHTEQVLFTQYTVKIGAVQGGAVNIVAPKGRAAERIRPRREPPHILPRSVPGFVDRNREQGLVGQALVRGQVVDIHAPDGTGKTALTSQAMQAQLPSAFPGGMVYLSARHEAREDLLQDLFETFFESDEHVKVTENDVRRHMAGTRALIAVDDANLLEEGEAQDLAQVVPQCALLIAAREQQVWQGTGISLRGLPTQHAVQLFERYWGPVEEKDHPTVAAICEAVGSIPLSIIKTATTAAQKQLSLDQVLGQVQPKDGQPEPRALALGLIASQLSLEERLVLGGLAAPGGPTVGVEALPVITGLPMKEVTRHLALLQAQGLVYANSPRFSFDDGLRPQIEGAWTSEEMRAKAAEYYSGKAAALQHLPRDPDEENVLCALDYYFQRGRWQQVVAIARSIDRYLACTGRWGQWRRRLDQAMQAAKELGDRATEAWAQNQLGIIAMGAGETAVAKQLFRSALSIRRAISDRPGVVVTRWNLHLLMLPPPTPWNRLLNKIGSILKSGSLWVPVGLAAVASLAIVALVSASAAIAGPDPSPTYTPTLLAATLTPSITPPQPTLTPTPIPPTVTSTPTDEVPPSIEVRLASGCNGTLTPGTPLSIWARSSHAGHVAIYLVDPWGDRGAPFEADVQAQEIVSQASTVPEWEGSWMVRAVLNDGQASDECNFVVSAPIEPAVEIPPADPPPTPVTTVSVWLPEGCGHMYEPGAPSEIYVQASIAGQVDVSLVKLGGGGTQFLFSELVQAGQVTSRGWNLPELGGDWSLAAVLNGGQAREYCGFTVQLPAPTVDIELAGGCDQVYEPGSATGIRLLASESGTVTVSLYDPAGSLHYRWDVEVEAGQPEGWTLPMPKEQGDWLLEAVLGDDRASDLCRFTVQPPPTVDIRLARGCDQVYEPGTATAILLVANESGTVVLSLYDPDGSLRSRWDVDVEAEQSKVWKWLIPEEQGDWELEAILGDDRASDVCRFTVQEPMTTVDIELAGGCGQVYEQGAVTQVRLWASVGGSVHVFLADPKGSREYLFSRDVVANQSTYADWTVAGGVGSWGLVAVLNDGQAEDTCSFWIRPEPAVWIETDRGCGHTAYEQGSEMAISFMSSVNGYLTVRVSGRETPLFSNEVGGGKTYGLVREVDMEPGWQQLSAELAGEEASAVCDFLVLETATATPIETTPVPVEKTVPPKLAPTSMPEATLTPPAADPTCTPPPTATSNPG